MKLKLISYVGPFMFPWGQAGSRRVCGVSRSIAKFSDVVIISGDIGDLSYRELDEGEPSGKIVYKGIGELEGKRTSGLLKFFQYLLFWGAKTVVNLNSHNVRPTHIILYGGGLSYAVRMLIWCRRNNVKLIVDVVEWYSARQMKFGYFDPFYWGAQIALRFVYPRCDGIIAISRTLESYYLKKSCNVLRVPPTLDVQGKVESTYSFDYDLSEIRLVYAGTPGKKDMLKPIINALSSIDSSVYNFRIKLLILGPSESVVRDLIGSSLPSFVCALGQIPQKEVLKYIETSHFSVLLRENLFFTAAGFPTKFVESLSVGTPVIANLTSDIGEFLNDGVEGFVCADCSAKSFVSAVLRISELDNVTYMRMRMAALKLAEKSFDFRVYEESVNAFLDHC